MNMLVNIFFYKDLWGVGKLLSSTVTRPTNNQSPTISTYNKGHCLCDLDNKHYFCVQMSSNNIIQPTEILKYSPIRIKLNTTMTKYQF